MKLEPPAANGYLFGSMNAISPTPYLECIPFSTLWLSPCRGSVACVSQQFQELCRLGRCLLVGPTLPDRSRRRDLTKNSHWCSRVGRDVSHDTLNFSCSRVLQYAHFNMVVIYIYILLKQLHTLVGAA